MSVSLRTVLRWLDEQQIDDSAECWVLGSDTVEPVIDMHWTSDGHIRLYTKQPWSEPVPLPLDYGSVYGMLLGHYSGGGSLQWASQPSSVYQGSYVVNVQSAVFFLFLPSSIRIVESHQEKMEQRKKQAIELTRKIEESQSWPTSM